MNITTCEDNGNAPSGNNVNSFQQGLETGQESMVKEVTEDQKAERQKKLEMFEKLKEGKKG